MTSDAVEVTRWLVDVPSVSGTERGLADAVEHRLRARPWLTVDRDGDAVVARTDLGCGRRVILAGHLDTVPIADNVPSHRDGDRIYGCGSSDMKSGCAVMLELAETLDQPTCDVSYIYYDNEEVEAARNGLGRLAVHHPGWLEADLAVLLEPTDGKVEAGCQGTLRAEVAVPGRRAHSARSWLGANAIHAAAPLLARLADYQPRTVSIDGCTYREGLSAVAISGGVAGNVVPDLCTVTVNFRFAPDRSEAQSLEHVQEVLSPYDVRRTDSAPAALPRLEAPAVRDFIAVVGGAPVAKYGWTDVSRFAALGIAAVNYGPGDPNLAHTPGESVEVARVEQCAATLRRYLGG